MDKTTKRGFVVTFLALVVLVGGQPAETASAQFAKAMLGGVHTPTRIAGATPATPLAIASGSTANINDNNTATKCEVVGVASTDFWFTMDLGSAHTVIKAELKQWYETGTGDSGFDIRYSNSPLNGGNTGSSYTGSSFSASTSAQDTTQIGAQSGRYWGLLRGGNFVGNNVGVADFNLYE